MTDRSLPRLSVVLVAPGDFGTIARTVDHLGRQTVRDQIELVVVAADPDALRESLEAAGAGFQDARVVEHRPITSRGRAAATGVRASRAEIVAFAENHCFPDPEWAEAFLAAHAGPWAVVGPAVRNANPETRTSRISFLMTYASWHEPAEAAEVDLLPFHNSAYKREWLDAYGERLGPLLDEEYWLQHDIRARGGRLRLEPRARTAHVNEPALGVSLRLLLSQGRGFGAGRSRSWSPLRRAAYVLGSPVIPFVNLPGAVRAARGPMDTAELLRSLPAIGLHVAAAAAGEALGYLLKRGGDTDFLHAHEFSARVDAPS